MKKNWLLTVVLVFSASLGMTQENAVTILPLLGEDAPSFTAESTIGKINFPKDYGDKWKIIFSHPADFTPVCSSELIELAAIQDDLIKMNVDIIVVSTDNLDTHKQWVKSLESLDYKDKKTAKINFPLVDDNNRSVAKKYGMIQPGMHSTRDVRGVFIIDPKNKIRAMFYYPMNIGRNTDEIKRTVLALQTADKYKILTPGNWQTGDDVLVPYIKYADAPAELAKQEDPDAKWNTGDEILVPYQEYSGVQADGTQPADPQIRMVSWYMWLKNMK